MFKRFFIIIIILCSLPVLEAQAKEAQADLGLCYFRMAFLHDDENVRLSETFSKLSPFVRLRVMARAQKFPSEEFHLDEPLTISIDKNQAKQLYNFVLSLWPKAEMEKLSKLLDKITSENISDKEFQKNLKITRGWLKRLRSAAIALSSDHRASRDLDRLIVVMGRIKDLVKNGNDKDAAKFLPDFKDLLSPSSRDLIAREISKFKPNSRDQFDQWLNGELENLKSRIKENDIKPKQFHDLRKFVDHLTATY
jgi:hypothetical protein